MNIINKKKGTQKMCRQEAKNKFILLYVVRLVVVRNNKPT